MVKKKIKYGNVHIPAEDFHPSKEKVKITMWVPGDVLDAYKVAAEKSGKGYQTLMNEKLREAATGLDEDLKVLREKIHLLEARVNDQATRLFDAIKRK